MRTHSREKQLLNLSRIIMRIANCMQRVSQGWTASHRLKSKHFVALRDRKIQVVSVSA